MTNINHIRELIAQNRPIEALQILQKDLRGTETELHNDVIILRFRLKKSVQELNKGIIPQAQADQTRVQICQAVLDICDDLKELNKQLDQKTNRSGYSPTNKPIYTRSVFKRFFNRILNF